MQEASPRIHYSMACLPHCALQVAFTDTTALSRLGVSVAHCKPLIHEASLFRQCQGTALWGDMPGSSGVTEIPQDISSKGDGGMV